MIIGVDGNEANVNMKVGVSFYTFNLLRFFRKKANKNLRFKIFLKYEPRKDLPPENNFFTYEHIKGKYLWSQIFLPIRLNLIKDIDVFFSPAHFAPRFCPVPTVVTIHDLSYHFYPEDFLKKDLYTLINWTKYSTDKARKIIAVSKTTMKDIVNVYKIPDENSSKFTIERPSILYVGTLQPRKNIETLIRAFAKFQEKYPEFELVLAGKKGWMYNKIYELVTDLGLDNDVFITDYITDYQLGFLYKNAFCLVMPSFYEGFGLPVLEAMGSGCPVISSFSSSLPEVGGEACLYFDPKSQDKLLEKLLLLKENKKIRQELIQKGKTRTKDFSWKTCGEQTLNILRDAAKKE